LDQLLFPIELPSTQSATPVSGRPTIEEDGGRRDGHGDFTTSFKLGSSENPILTGQDDDEGYTESESQSAQYPILSDDRDDISQHDNTVLESDGRPSTRPVQALPCGSSTCTLQQSCGGYPRERSPAALSKVENTGGINGSAMDKRDIELLLPTTVQSLEDTLYGDTPIEPVAITRETSHNTNATLTDRIEPGSNYGFPICILYESH
jgi:hypothetical protein